MTISNREIFHRVWEGFLASIGAVDKETNLISRKQKAEPVARSMSMSRLREQLWYALDEAEGGWAYPIDIFVGDNGTDIFSIVAQSGKLFHVPLSISEETVTLGDWIQVKEEYTPVTQNRFFIRRQSDGRYRWTAVAATTVLNRVGQIDSAELFDSFVEKAEKRGKYPRLDFYHYGETDPTVWEFGTADFLARDGVCYIASGLFDEGHPLATATIRACEEGEDEWGCSIEFYAYAEPEIIIADPEVRIPVYKDGENTRISLVLEEDAAGLFTRMSVKEGVQRTMDKATKAALEKLYGTDTDGLNDFLAQFEEGVDETNQRVKNDKLIHRVKDTSEAALGKNQEDKEEEEDDGYGDAEAEDEVDSEIVLDEAGVAALSKQIISSPQFESFLTSMDEVKQLIAQSIVDREAEVQEIEKLKKSNVQLLKAVERLSKDDTEKKLEYLQDLPAKKRQTVTVRPRDIHEPIEDSDILDDYEEIATRTLNGLPSY